MYLSEIHIKNFRCFDEFEHIIKFNPNLNVIVGENDSGKSAVVDAIRIVLGTTDQGWYRINQNDFFNEDKSREISITCHFKDLTDDECAYFLECLTYDEIDLKKKPSFILNWNCKYLNNFVPARTLVTLNSGINGNGPMPAAEAREVLRVTYLRALRDSYSDMQSGKSSRLSQIIQSIPEINTGEQIYSDNTKLEDLSIAGIADLSNKLLASNPNLLKINNQITNILRNNMLLHGDSLQTKLQVAGMDTLENKRLVALLEKLDLETFNSEESSNGLYGLGTSNIISMACEMLLNNDLPSNIRIPFLLIEEPEAHIHAQRQLRLIQSLQNESLSKPQQIIITTHSPVLASAIDLENIIIMNKSQSFSLAKENTKLCNDDYYFLSRFLDATKANLFFAKSILIVEGSSEELLLPTLSRILNRDFVKYGVSIVNVRGVGLRRFAKIFHQKDESKKIPIPVACITDRDIMPDCAPAICIDEKYTSLEYFPKKSRKWKVESEFDTITKKNEYINEIKNKADGQNVKTFVSNHWTLEYDMFYSGLQDEMIEALVCVKYSATNKVIKYEELKEEVNKYLSKEEKASSFYKHFYSTSISKAEFAQTLAKILLDKYSRNGNDLIVKLPSYLILAIEYVTEKIENHG